MASLMKFKNRGPRISGGKWIFSFAGRVRDELTTVAHGLGVHRSHLI